jgi:DNA invertase Pin-like site-specific DNA recombinase
MKKVRCAIYTRKSSEEGLEQEFNSLHAQREACASFIASQKHEGWVLLPNHYDDGGISGGTLERDGLKQLMADVDDGLIDQIVVYKIDRLTRSLSDFAKLVDRLDAAEASFVSVTQSFNTATSMGRLTLNVLLSFAQFEREVTAERIRDKIAASKKKGLWMGGNVPLGYEPDGRTLKIVKEEATTIRAIYDLYQSHGTVDAVIKQANRHGLQSIAKHGANRGKSINFQSSQVHYILTNPVYAGKIRHKDKIHEGQHEAIIDPDRWNKIQAQLKDGAARQRGTRSTKTMSLLSGKLFDETGDHLTSSHANKQGKRYRYYISNRLITKQTRKSQASKTPPGNSKPKSGWRLPAKALEQQIASSIVDHLEAHLVTDLFEEPDADQIKDAQSKCADLIDQTKSGQLATTLSTLKQVTITAGMISVQLEADTLADLFEVTADGFNPTACTFDAAFQFRKRGSETKLVIGNKPMAEPDQILIDNIARAHHYYDAIKAGMTFDQVAASNNITKRRLLQIIDLAFLAPDIVKSIMTGDQPDGLTTKWFEKNPLPSNWQAQREIVARL